MKDAARTLRTAGDYQLIERVHDGATHWAILRGHRRVAFTHVRASIEFAEESPR